jgi:quinol-cytochrome oxidoreductase complex cytochrome b subunit
MAEEIEKDGLRGALSNIGALLKNLKSAVLRHGPRTTQRARAETVFGNVFMHIHATRTHRWSLRKSFTMGLGVASAALFGILLFTGILLMIYFKPTTATAYNSVKDIQYIVPGGRIIRNVHRWSAHLMVAAVLMHMFRVMLTGSYRKPREFNWLIGLVLLVLTLAMSFTGYCLPWDQLGYWATTIGVNIASSTGEVIEASGMQDVAPDVPGFTKKIMLGSHSIGDDAMLRFYVLHCIVLPLGMVMAMAVHFWRIRKDGGMSRPSDITDKDLKGTPKESGNVTVFKPEKTHGLMALVKGSSPSVNRGPENTVQSWPALFYYEMAVAMGILFVVLLAGIIFNAPLAEIANPSVPENPAKAPWYFLGLQECVSYSAFSGGMLIPTICLAGLALIPFVDRGTESGRLLGGAGEVKIFMISSLFAAAITVGMLAFTVRFGWMRNWWPDVNQMWIILFNPGTILAAIYTFYVMTIVFLTKSIRRGIVAYSACFIVGFIILTYFGSVHRGPNWQFYWWPSQWPIH